MPRRTARPHARTDPRSGHQHPGLPRLRPAALGRQQAAAGPSSPSMASSGSGSRSAAAATPNALAIGICLRPEQEGRYALPQHEFGLDVIARSAGSDTPSTAASPRSTPSWPAAACRSACGASPTSWIATTSSGPLVLRRRRLTAITAAGRPRDPGHRRPPARRRPRGPLGPPRRAQRRGPPGQEPALLDAGRPGQAPRRGQGVLDVPIAGVVSDGQTSIREAVAEALRACPISSAISTTSARRPGRSTRPTATPRSSSRRRSAASGRSSGRSRAGTTPRPGDPGLLRGGAFGVDRRRPAAAGGIGAEAPGPAGEGRREPGPGRIKKGLPNELERFFVERDG